MAEPSTYTPPNVWIWNKESGGKFAGINRPIAGATHDKELPVGLPTAALFASDAEWPEGHNHAGRVAGARPNRRRI